MDCGQRVFKNAYEWSMQKGAKHNDRNPPVPEAKLVYFCRPSSSGHCHRTKYNTRTTNNQQLIMVLDNMDGLTSLGVMGKISTGSSSLDVLLCLMLPALLRWVTQKANEILENKNIWAELVAFFAWQSGKSTVCQRCITHENVSRPWWYADNGTEGVHNHILQRAVLLYINSLQDVARKFENAQLLLHAPPSDIGGGRNCPYDSSDDEDAEQDEATRLAAYTVVASPPEGAWVKVVKKPDGSIVEFMRNEESQSTGGDEHDGGKSTSKQTIDFHLRSTSHTMDPESLLRDFVADAYKFYIAQMAKENKDCRYFYQPVTKSGSSGDGDGDGSSLKYKRYPLSDAKTFGNGFFHPDKEPLLALIDHFTNKTGKFAIAGFPHKLGLLLHGPPGTGKTSLIKALAQYTGRHIISIPLNRIGTNQELMDIMFDRQYHVAGQDLPVRLPFSKTIFVMEDVDAACDVVNKRSSSPSEASIWTAKATSSSPTAPPIGPALPGDDKLAELFKSSETKDKLNLAGLLNVLDGVLDSPERIVIMTTNHPEKLDPALIRPGRINKRVFLGYLKPRQALQMVEHYFGKISTTEAHSIWQTVSEHSFTPATLEMMCGEHDTAKELCIALASEAAIETKKTTEAVMQRQALSKAGSAPFDTVACQVACAS